MVEKEMVINARKTHDKRTSAFRTIKYIFAFRKAV